jgi:hypothetical protein
MGNSINVQRQQQQHILQLQQQLQQCQRQRRNNFANGNISDSLADYSSYLANGGTRYNPDPIQYAQGSTYTSKGRTSPYGYTTDWGTGINNIQSGGSPDNIMRRRT